MTCSIKSSNGTLVGLNEIVYTLTPPAQSDFKYSVKTETFKEPRNIFEGIRNLFDLIFNYN